MTCLLIFDFDDTLVNTTTALDNAVSKILPTNEYSVEDFINIHEIDKLLIKKYGFEKFDFYKLAYAIHCYLTKRNISTSIKQTIDFFDKKTNEIPIEVLSIKEILEKQFLEPSLFPEVPRVIKTIARTNLLILISEGIPGFQEKKIERFPLLNVFNIIKIVTKKTYKIFLEAKKDAEKMLGSPASRVYVIGDSCAKEIAFGNKLGAITVLIDRKQRFISRHINESYVEPSYRIQSLEEMLDWIQ